LELITENRFTVAITTIWSGLGYVLSKDAVKILTEEEVEKRMARSDANKHN
jgi:cardiolipin synthase